MGSLSLHTLKDITKLWEVLLHLALTSHITQHVITPICTQGHVQNQYNSDDTWLSERVKLKYTNNNNGLSRKVR